MRRRRRGAFGVSCAVSERLAADGLDDDAQRNLVELIRSQRAATGIIPDDKTLVVERCEDEQGDWRVLLHSPYGRRVHEPWAMAVSDRIIAIYGYDAQAMAADDGIVLRIPMTETRLPGIELFAFDPDELDRIARDRVGSTSLFSARFRECAARALLMSPIAPASAPRCGSSASRPASCWRPPGASAPSVGNGARVLAGRVRHEGAARADGAGAGGIGALGGGADVGAVAVRGAASVRVRGRAPLRGRSAACRATRVAAVARPHAVGRAAGLDRLGRRSGRGRDRRRGGRLAAPCSRSAHARHRGRGRLAARAGAAVRRGGGVAHALGRRSGRRRGSGRRGRRSGHRRGSACAARRAAARPSGVSGRVGRQGALGGRRRCGVSARCAGRDDPPVGRRAQPSRQPIRPSASSLT